MQFIKIFLFSFLFVFSLYADRTFRAGPNERFIFEGSTKAIKIPNGTTAQRPTGSIGEFRYNSDTNSFEGYTTSWGAIAGAGGEYTFDPVNGSYLPKAQDYADTSGWSTGNNATVMGAGSIVGAFTRSTTAAELMDASRTAVWKYDSGTGGTTLNDYFCTAAVTIPQGVRDSADSGYQSILAKSWYWSETDRAFTAKMYCVNGTSAGVLSQASRDATIAQTDWDADGAKDAGEGDFLFNNTGIAWNVPSDCTQVRLCYQVTTELGDNISFFADDIKFGVTPTNAVDVDTYNSWTAFSPTGNFTNTTYTGMWRRVYDDLEMRIYMLMTGTPGSTTLMINFPTSICLSVDTNKLIGASQMADAIGSAFDTSAGAVYALRVYYAGSSLIGVRALNTSSSYASHADVTQAVPFTFAVNDSITFKISLPCAQWAAGY